ncbi:hypothetical protein ZIOFF_048560 [Zingiber officinale]|uniref:Uncharacterized protein n=1 Tax=Zingiber officinale TaxID=94328 RepID=A0A8J5FRD3_ZINOF|nr:hypothetical protein ZIOFF_048560 [Zingiber officinale]
MASADIVKADCMKIYENERLRLHEMLDKIHSRVSLTVDMWKSIADMDYVCLTCHYVDNDWRLQKKILNFFPLGPSELGQDVSKTIMEKLCAVLLDNCSTSEFVAKSDVDNASFLSPKDWEDVRAVIECLDVLYQALEKFSATKVPTANLYLNDMCGLHLLLKTWYKSPQPFVACMAKEMLEKFEQYWDSNRMLMAIASVLDPRYKMKSVEYFFKQIYDDAFEAKTRIDNVRDSFIIYITSEYVNGGECKTSRITLSDTQRGLDQYLKETSSGHPARSDLDMYLEEAVHPSKGSEDNFDILAWWKYIAARYPVHSMMARDIMGIRISVVPLDSEARTLNQYLSSTDPAIIECLLIISYTSIFILLVSPVYDLAIAPSTAYLETNGDECMLPAGCD